MTIRPVHTDGTITLEQYRALNLTRPLCDGPIGSTTGGRRSNDEAASRAFDEPDHPGRRAIGPRGHLNHNGDLTWDTHKPARSPQKARRAVQPAPTEPHHPETENAT